MCSLWRAACSRGGSTAQRVALQPRLETRPAHSGRPNNAPPAGPPRAATRGRNMYYFVTACKTIGSMSGLLFNHVEHCSMLPCSLPKPGRWPWGGRGARKAPILISQQWSNVGQTSVVQWPNRSHTVHIRAPRIHTVAGMRLGTLCQISDTDPTVTPPAACPHPNQRKGKAMAGAVHLYSQCTRPP